MDDAQLQRRQAEQRDLQERLQNRERVQVVFAKYGGDACRVIWEELRRHQGLHPVIQKLGLPPAASLEQEFEMLQRFLGEHGPGKFIQRVRPTHNMLDWNLYDTPSPAESAAGARTQIRTPLPGAPPSAPPAATKPPALRAGDPATLGPAAITPPHWFDAHGTYIGPERRMSTSDRRSSRDRRNEVESISKNKRFGGDRRKTRGRRKSDSR